MVYFVKKVLQIKLVNCLLLVLSIWGMDGVDEDEVPKLLDGVIIPDNSINWLIWLWDKDALGLTGREA